MFEIEKILEPDITLVCKLNADGSIAFINQAYTDITGFSEKDLTGESHEIIQHPKMPKIILDEAWENIRTKERSYLISKNIVKNGEYFWTVADINNRLNQSKNKGIFIRRKYLPSNIKDEISKLYEILYGIENSGGKEIAKKYLNGWLEDRNVASMEEYIFEQFGGEKNLKKYLTTEISDKELFSTDPTSMNIDEILKFVNKKKKRRFW
jgi:PAS domain S-box-containing protein